MSVIHATQRPLTKKRPGITACDREFNLMTSVSDLIDLVTCRRCLKRLQTNKKTIGKSKKPVSIDPDQLNQYIALQIIRFRKTATMTQGQLAEAANMTRVRVSLLERGHIRIGVADILVLAEIFGKKVADFLPNRKTASPR